MSQTRPCATLSDAGRAALRNDRTMPPMTRLTMELINLAGGTMGQDNCAALVHQLIAEYGSVDDALIAIKSGEIALDVDA
jgi:hypothetical protein